MSKAGTPSDVNYIFVRANEKGSVGRRVLLPKTMAALKKSSQSAIKESRPILSILTETGVPIQSIEEISPGMTVIASTEEMSVQKEENKGNVMSFAEIEALGFIGQTQRIDPGDVSIAQSLALSQSSSRGRTSGTSSGLLSPVSGGQSVATKGRFSGSISRGQRSMAPSTFDESQMGKSTMSRRRPQVEPTNIQFMLHSLLPEDKSLADVDFMVRTCLEKDFLLNLITFEEKQRHYWYNQVLSQPLFQKSGKFEVYDETQKYAAATIEENRFISGHWVDHRLRMAVIGPKKSGKSVLLNEISKQYASEMAYTGEWKNCFVFALDVEEVLPLFTNIQSLFSFFVERTIDAILAQKPVLEKELHTAKKQLLSILEFQAHDIKLSSIGLLDEVLIQLSNYWRDEDAAVQFFDYVLSLPLVISQAVGYDRMLWIIDNIDKADVQVAPSERFKEVEDFIFVVEHLKAVIDKSNFILACADTERFFQTMAPIDENGTDVLAGTNYITTTDVAEVDEEDIGDHFAIRVRNYQLPILLNISMCGGVVHYLHNWDELCHLMNNLEQAKNEEQAEKSLFELLAHAQDVVELLYKFEGIDEVLVENVSRVSYNDM